MPEPQYYKGIFWRIDGELVCRKVRCDETCAPLEPAEFTSKSGENFNHKAEWVKLPRRETCRLLLSALYENHRLENQRYCFLDLKADTDLSRHVYDALYRASFGGAVIVRYFADGDAEESNAAFASDGENIQIICETVKRYRNHVLTVFRLPRACENLKRMFYENLASVLFVELREELADTAQTRAF